MAEPAVGEERLIVATLDNAQVCRERQSFDPAGHYAQPDVTRLTATHAPQSSLNDQ